MRNLPKVAWLLLILLFPVVGPVAWLLAGRPTRALGAATRRGALATDHAARAGPSPPARPRRRPRLPQGPLTRPWPPCPSGSRAPARAPCPPPSPPSSLGTAAAHLLGRADLALAHPRPRRRPRAAGRGQLRQRLLRRHPRHRRGPGRAGAPGRPAARRARQRQARGDRCRSAPPGVVGLALVALSEAWVMLPLGALAVLAAWRYTGGDNPYGYRGLGEVYVFVFFGLMATLGTLYTQADAVTLVRRARRRRRRRGRVGDPRRRTTCATSRPTPSTASGPSPCGSATAAPGCSTSGSSRSRCSRCAGMAFWRALGAARPARRCRSASRAVRTVLSGTTGRDLVPVLAATGLYEVAYAVLAALGVVIGVALR